MRPQVKDYQRAWQLMMDHQRIVVLAHQNPDADALGSAAALSTALRQQGKQVDVVVSGKIPQHLSFLPGLEQIRSNFGSQDLVLRINTHERAVQSVQQSFEPGALKLTISPGEGVFSKADIEYALGNPQYDLIICLDTSEPDLLGEHYQQHQSFFEQTPVINMDHHLGNTNYGSLNVIDPQAAATAEQLFYFFQANEVAIDQHMATALLAGIVTDTGSFQHTNTSGQAFNITAELMELGADHQQIVEQVYRTKEVTTLKLWGRIFSRVKLQSELSLVWSEVTAEDLEATGAEYQHGEVALNDFLTAVPDVEVYLLLYEYPDGVIRGSLRSAGEKDVSALARLFGGGGHPAAAGFRIRNKTLIEAREHIFQTLGEHLHTSNVSPPSAEGKAGEFKPMTAQEIIDRMSELIDERKSA